MGRSVKIESGQNDDLSSSVLILRLLKINSSATDIEKEVLCSVLRHQRHDQPAAADWKQMNRVVLAHLWHRQQRIRFELREIDIRHTLRNES